MTNQVQGYRLSPQQESIWSLEQEGFACQARCAVSVEGAIDGLRLKEALLSLVTTHQILRTTFQRSPGIKAAIQVITAEAGVDWQMIDLSEEPAQQQEVSLAELTEEQRTHSFDLQQGPMLRATLISTSSTTHRLLLSLPSLCCDERGMSNLVAGLRDAYGSARAAGQASAEPIQYVQFSEWQNQLLDDQDAQAGIEYWAGLGLPEELDLRLGYEGKGADTQAGETQVIERVIEADVAGKIQQLCWDNQVEVKSMMLACWGSLLGRLTGCSEVVVAEVVEGRKFEEMEGAIGVYSRWVPVRCELDGGSKFREVVSQVSEAAAEAYQWQEYYDWGTGFRATGGVGYQYQLEATTTSAGGAVFTIIEQQASIDRFKLLLRCLSKAEGLAIELLYDSSIYSQESMNCLAQQYQTVVSSAVANPDWPVSELDVVSAEERRQLVEGFNQTDVAYASDRCIHEMIERQAVLTPDRVAVVCGAQELSYGELEQRANQLGNYLRREGVEPEQVVAICMGRSVELVVALLGIMKAGAAYLPVDVEYPRQRQEYMLRDGGVKVLVKNGEVAAGLEVEGVKQVDIEALSEQIKQQSKQRVNSGVMSENLAYVIYTSGSTGNPKGVMIEHRGVVNYLSWSSNAYRVAEGTGSLVHTSIGFDLTVTSLFAPLVVGQRVQIITEQEGIEGLTRALSTGRDHSLVKLTPSHLEILSEMMSEQEMNGCSRVMVIGGEALRAETLRKWTRSDHTTRLINEYGPTETVVGCCVYEVKQADTEEGDVAIGRPIANTQMYILDDTMRLAAVGVSGEIYIGGEGVARGYKGKPEQTADKFVPDPYGKQPGARLYKTGDQARYLPTGDLEYLGRIDNQVKIRGYRIELGEIEAAISRCDGVRDAAAVVREDQGEEKRIVGYVVWKKGEQGSVSELKRQMSQRLPDYMVPAVIVELDEMPLTTNAKLDRHSLPAPDDVEIELSRAFVAPRTITEEILVDLWGEVLGLKAIGIHDDFFELGGHSLLATQLFSRLKRTLNVEMPLRTLFETPTVAGLAEKIDLVSQAEQGLQSLPLVRVHRDGELPLSFAQQRLWFLDRLEPDNAFYNIPAAIRLTGELDVDALERSFNEVVRRHEALRTTFAEIAGRPVQIISDSLTVPLTIDDLSTLPEHDREAEAARLANLEAQHPFDLRRGPLLRTKLLKLAEDHHCVLLTIHHIVSDGWSAGVFIKEVAVLYQAYHNGEQSPLEELAIQYADYAAWQREWLSGDRLEEQLSYWKKELEGASAVLELGTDRPRPAVQSFGGSSVPVRLSKEVTESLKRLSRSEGATLFMVVLAAYKALLYRYSGQQDISVGTPIANRNRAEVEGLIGFFVNTLVMRTQLSGELSFKQVLKQVREVAIAAYAHQDIPFEQLVDQLQPERDLSHNPLFQVMFILQNTPVAELELEGLSLRGLEADSRSAKFDLTLSLQDSAQGLSGTMEYNTDLWEEQTIARMVSHFHRLVESVAANADQRLWEIEVLSEAERHKLVVEWNETEAEYPADKCVHELIQEQVEQRGNEVAVIFEGRELSYDGLNRRANQMARYLTELGVGVEDLVGVCVERSEQMVVALLGILKTGAAYLPMDPGYPEHRLKQMLEDGDVKVVVSERIIEEKVRGNRQKVVRLDEDWEEISRRSDENPSPAGSSANLAYVIYTSGSTGRPKGVEVEHRAVVNFLQSMSKQPGMSNADKLLAVTTISFDIAALELYLPLIVGGQVEVASREEARDGVRLSRRIAESGATVMQATPATWTMLVEAGWEGAKQLKALCGGEAVRNEVGRQLKERGSLLWNVYGPTETTIWSAAREVGRWEESGLIGQPISNTQMYILGEHLELVPEGVAGELYIGGEGVARGYKNNAEQTAERFVPDPYCGEAGVRMYKTGDLVRQAGRGSIEYLGRIDDQVKVRGYRIEVGEIEEVMRGHDAVKQCVVAVREDAIGEKRLVAYVVGDRDFKYSDKKLAAVSQAEQLSQWGAVWNTIYKQSSTGQETTFNIAGWNSSYTGKPIPEQEMREWVEHTVERIASLSPRSVLEIGCGTGLILFPIAHQSSKYVGTDISSAALSYVREIITEHQQQLTQVTLLQRSAEDFEGLAEREFDVVILNSVVQYFPSLEYLGQVINGAVMATRPGGHIFIGDVRDLGLVEAMHTSVEMHHSAGSMRKQELKQRIEKEVSQEQELVISPVYFKKLKEEVDQIRHVEIQMKRGGYDNELTRYRYDVVIEVGGEPEEQVERTEIKRFEWQKQGLSVRKLEEILEDQEPEVIIVSGVPNGRVKSELNAKEMLISEDGPDTVAEMKEVLESKAEGVQPEEIWTMSEQRGYTASIARQETEASDAYQVVMRRGKVAWWEVAKGLGGSQEEEARTRGAGSPAKKIYANNPLQGIFARKLVPELKGYLKERLPEYMMPEMYVMIEELPLTPNGKINRGALPAAATTRAELETAFIAPRTELEEIVSAIWSDVLGVVRIGVRDNFFELGGHSLLATQVVSRIRERLGQELPLRSVFEHPTVAGMSAMVESLGGANAPPVKMERVERLGRQAVSYSQQRLWFIHQMEPASSAYNMAVGVRISGELKADILEVSLNEVLRRHDVLRTRFVDDEGVPLQEVMAELQLLLPVIDVSKVAGEDLEETARLLANEEAKRPFDLRQAPLLRVLLLRLDEQHYVLVFTIHHIISDAWSMGVLVRETALLYGAYSNGKPSPLAELPIQYADFAAWQRKLLSGEVLEEQLSYWKQQLRDAPTVLDLPLDRPRPGVQTNRGAIETLVLPQDLSEELKALSRREGVTLFMTLLTAFQTLLHRYTQQDEILVGTNIANRNRAELEGLIGFFINNLVLRADLSDCSTLRDLLKQMREVALGAYAHQELPFERLVEELQPERRLSHNPLFQVMFALQNTPIAPITLPGLTLTTFDLSGDTSVFDLLLNMQDTEAGLVGTLQYNGDLFNSTTMVRMLRHFQTVLEAMVEDLDRELNSVSFMTEEQSCQQIYAFNLN